MRHHLTPYVIITLVTACAAGGAGSLFEFRPSESPQRYELTVSGDVVAETPMGSMESKTRSEATVLLDIGQRLGDGWRISATFEALEVTAEGSMGGGSVRAEEVLGKPYSGTLSSAGLITITDAPAASSRLTNSLDPGALFTDLLVPLPPVDVSPTDSWPVNSTVLSDAAVRLMTVFAGTARFAADTIWNGVQARLIIVDGTIEIEGSGAPAGAPAEVDMVLSGESTRLYVWDASRNLMLASLVTIEAEGSMSIAEMNLSMPARMSSRQNVALKQ